LKKKDPPQPLQKNAAGREGTTPLENAGLRNTKEKIKKKSINS
jgi:hypothetical protein